MVPDALFIIAVWILTGMGFGMLATAYGACRRTYRFPVGVGEILDWLWFVVAGAGFLVMLFWTEWGMFRVSSILFVLIGYGLWSWLAAPVVLGMFLVMGHAQARVAHYALVPGRWVFGGLKRQLQRRKKPPPKE
ncbi:MAG: hypothetical protein M1272_03605 [Firmicutes bacterium]|nr:hypothetical protein [Bacillota bacterium]